MARQILASLIVRLKNEVGAEAKNVEKSLDAIGRAADRLNKKGSADALAAGLERAQMAAKEFAKAMGGDVGWGKRFTDQISKLKATQAEVDRLKASWQKLGAEIKANTDAGFKTAAIASWKNQALAALIAVRQESQRMAQAQVQASREAEKAQRQWAQTMRRGAGFAAGAVGMGGGAYMANRGITAATQYGGGLTRQGIREVNAGITPTEQLALIARAQELSKQYPSLTPLDARETAKNLIPNVGNFQKAMELLPEYLRGRVALKTVSGTGADDGEMEKFARFVDIAGRSTDIQATRTLLDGYIRARQLDNKALKADDYVQFAQTAGSAGKGIGVDFLSRVLPALVMQSGGFRTGTDIASAYQNAMIARGTKESVAEQVKFGIREKGKGKKLGKLVDEGLYASNPYEWMKKHILPRLAKEGAVPKGYATGDYSESLNEDQRAALSKRMSAIFSNRRGASIFSLMAGDVQQIEQVLRRLEQAKGTSNVEGDQQKDPFVAFDALTKQLTNFAGVLAEPGLAQAGPILHGLASGLSALSTSLSQNPDMAGMLGVGAGAAGAGLAAWVAKRVVWNRMLGMGAGAKEVATSAGSGVAGTAAAGGGLLRALLRGGIQGAGLTALLFGADKMAADSDGTTPMGRAAAIVRGRGSADPASVREAQDALQRLIFGKTFGEIAADTAAGAPPASRSARSGRYGKALRDGRDEATSGSGLDGLSWSQIGKDFLKWVTQPPSGDHGYNRKQFNDAVTPKTGEAQAAGQQTAQAAVTGLNSGNAVEAAQKLLQEYASSIASNGQAAVQQAQAIMDQIKQIFAQPVQVTISVNGAGAVSAAGRVRAQLSD